MKPPVSCRFPTCSPFARRCDYTGEPGHSWPLTKRNEGIEAEATVGWRPGQVEAPTLRLLWRIQAGTAGGRSGGPLLSSSPSTPASAPSLPLPSRLVFTLVASGARRRRPADWAIFSDSLKVLTAAPFLLREDLRQSPAPILPLGDQHKAAAGHRKGSRHGNKYGPAGPLGTERYDTGKSVGC